jgi:MYXO-CTERM domain-containing protein
MYRVAFYALTGLGFGWGLENLDASGQIGGGFTGNGLHFGDTCVPVTAALCTDHIGCAAEQQDSTADLLARLGARIDDGAPVVAITSPEPGPVNSEFTLTADVTDGFGGLTVTLDIVEAAQEVVDPVPPYEWTLNMPDGNWTLRVEVTDADGNEVAEDVELCVGDEACGLTPGTDTGGGSSSGEAVDESVGDTGGASSSSEGSGGGSSSGGSSSGDDTGSPADPSAPLEPTTFGGDSADTGCGCRHDAPRTGGVAWALLALAGLAIRRRRVTPRG